MHDATAPALRCRGKLSLRKQPHDGALAELLAVLGQLEAPHVLQALFRRSVEAKIAPQERLAAKRRVVALPADTANPRPRPKTITKHRLLSRPGAVISHGKHVISQRHSCDITEQSVISHTEIKQTLEKHKEHNGHNCDITKFKKACAL